MTMLLEFLEGHRVHHLFRSGHLKVRDVDFDSRENNNIETVEMFFY